MKTLYVANWKMNLRLADCAPFINQLTSFIGTALDGKNVEVVICPPFPFIPAVAEAINISGAKYLSCGAQNAHWQESGAHTGEISLGMLKEFKVSSVIIGHSERRLSYGETDANVAKRARAAMVEGLNAIVCVGETSREDGGNTAAAAAATEVTSQLRASLDGVESLAVDKLTIAYEPVWAIGTGKAATPSIITAIHNELRSCLVSIFGERGRVIPILYGGSTSPQNAAEILACANVSGVLVGNASLKPESFADIVLAPQKG